MRVKLYGSEDEDFAEARAYFDLDPSRKLCARFSEDQRALYIPALSLTPYLVRRVVQGGTLFQHLNGVALVGHSSEKDFTRWTYVWGNLRLFETGMPVVARAILMEGALAFPDLREVMKHVRSRLFDGRG